MVVSCHLAEGTLGPALPFDPQIVSIPGSSRRAFTDILLVVTSPSVTTPVGRSPLEPFLGVVTGENLVAAVWRILGSLCELSVTEIRRFRVSLKGSLASPRFPRVDAIAPRVT